ncbi:hypothetical protein [Colwellia ponticola]|uniref:Chemotaxis protein n=1 Tax=Colwellia ponticola TaxID=2304625 RepID=A0A8H2JLJ2_9GAMM|nr:hypothetical protein [Colwellia ponticola]TMM45758.1 hypothetical protein FCS21_08025 [Colwellia ponticola]
MKLILKQYLASLNERDELDVLVPDLLSQMGLNVYARPIRGANEYGVDVAAVGKIDGGIEKVYLFSIKERNLTRQSWCGGSSQDLLPSIHSILNSYIPHRLPKEHADKPIVICLCFGGDVQTTIRQEVTGFEQQHETESLKFEEWNGDKLSELILQYFLKEELLPKDWQSMLRKSIALLDEPEESHKHFVRLVRKIIKTDTKDKKNIYRVINRINICLWVLFSWGRDGNNVESSYLSAEFCILNCWDLIRDSRSTNARKSFDKLLSTYHAITCEYTEKCLIAHADKKHAISNAINSPSSIDINLKLFDFMSRLSMCGIWTLLDLQKLNTGKPPIDDAQVNNLEGKLKSIIHSIKLLIKNNPLLLSPYLDEQAIDISLAMYLLIQDSENDEFSISWLDEIAKRSIFSYKTDGMYPSTVSHFRKLLDHREQKSSSYKHSVTKGSILYPILAVFSALYENEITSNELSNFAEEELRHCTLQYWYPAQDSETYFYNNIENHGCATTGFEMAFDKVLDHVMTECDNSKSFSELSVVKKGLEPIVFLACRYYRYPLPIHSLYDFIKFKKVGA